MAKTGKCDIAIWDVEGSLTAELKGRLTHRRRQSGSNLSVVIGRWRDRTIAIGGPKRLTAAMLPSIGQSIRALAAAHDPAWLVVIGPAAAIHGVFRVGDVVREADSGLATVGEPIPSAPFTQGAVSDQDRRCLATAWSEAAKEATASLAMPADLMAVVTQATEEGQQAEPPSARPVTVARELGGWFGRLLRPSSQPRAPAIRPPSHAVGAAIAVLLPRRPHRD